MPKLLSPQEVHEISAKMTEEYGLAPPNILLNNVNRSCDSGLKCEIVREVHMPIYDWLPWFTKSVKNVIDYFYADNFEDLLTRLQNELTRYDRRTKIAESFREKYARKEADEALDKVLKD